MNIHDATEQAYKNGYKAGMKDFAEIDINRFVAAQEMPYFCGYRQALEEIRSGRKINHWIWYIFPQLRCLGRSSLAHYYGVADKDEAQRYLEHTVLGARIREITEADSMIHKPEILAGCSVIPEDE